MACAVNTDDDGTAAERIPARRGPMLNRVVDIVKTSRAKPVKACPSFRLTTHPNGHWYKMIRGKVHFFRMGSDPDAALTRHLYAARHLRVGHPRFERSPPRSNGQGKEK